MNRTMTVILGGGAGSRLFPLTKFRAKPAVPLAGKYRLIDGAISNCINSGLHHIFVLTQYLSASLNRHIAQTYGFDIFRNGFVEVLAAEQTNEGGKWFQGTADAIRQHYNTMEQFDKDLVLVLPGDALYAMDYRPLIEQHRRSGSEITIAVNTVPRNVAHHFGLLALDKDGTIKEFREKPKTREAQAGIEAPQEILQAFGIQAPAGDTFLASMGVYLFNRSVLEKYLNETEFDDFGKQIIPAAISEHKTKGFVFPGYWEDIGTIRAFYDAHMMLLEDTPRFNFVTPTNPVFTRPRNLPMIHATSCSIERALIAPGSRLEGGVVKNSVIGLRATIFKGAKVHDSVLMGADYYENEMPAHLHGEIPIGIGEGSLVKGAIVDKNARIGKNVVIANEKGVMEEMNDTYCIRDGIVIIPKNAVIPDGTVI